MTIQYVADYNPILFMQAFEEAVNNGLYADTSIESYPQLTAGLNEINLKDIERPQVRNDLDEANTVVIQGYEPIHFILDVQDAILQGFYIDVQSVAIGVNYAPHTVTLHRAPQGAKFSFPVGQGSQEAPNASQSATEAPVATKTTTTRKAKSKEA